MTTFGTWRWSPWENDMTRMKRESGGIEWLPHRGDLWEPRGGERGERGARGGSESPRAGAAAQRPAPHKERTRKLRHATDRFERSFATDRVTAGGTARNNANAPLSSLLSPLPRSLSPLLATRARVPESLLILLPECSRSIRERTVKVLLICVLQYIFIHCNHWFVCHNFCANFFRQNQLVFDSCGKMVLKRSRTLSRKLFWLMNVAVLM